MSRAGRHLPLLLVCLAVSVTIRLTVGVGIVSGLSMWPSLRPGDVVVYLRGAEPVQGAVVVADLPGHGLIIKRAVALGSQEVEDYGPGPLPAGTCFLVGDNRPISYDSRAFGPLPDRLILGRVVFVWPYRGGLVLMRGRPALSAR